MKPYSTKSFLLSITSILLFVLTFALAVGFKNFPGSVIAIGFLLGIITTIIGLIYGIKSIKEPSSAQQIVGLVLNGLMVFISLSAGLFIVMDLLAHS